MSITNQTSQEILFHHHGRSPLGLFESSFVHYINSLWRGDTIRQHKSGLTSPDSTKSLPEPIFTNHQ